MKINKGKKRRKKKINKIGDVLFKVIAIVSTLIMLFFWFMLIAIDMLPFKYLIIIYLVLGLIYGVGLFLTFSNKGGTKLKILSLIVFCMFGIVFCVGNKYLSDTMGFVDSINNSLLQKEEYFLMVDSDLQINDISELDGKFVGVYDSLNSESATSKLLKKLSFEEKKYSNIIDMFEDLESGNISAVLINSSIKNLLNSELEEMNYNIKEIYKFSISIKQTDTVKVVDVINTPFNIYIAGGDSYGTIDKVTNTDVNMVVSVDPVNKKLLLTSIPRDYYVNLSSLGDNAYDKLTHAGYYGIEGSVKAIEKLLDIEVNYYIKINFSTIEGIIDAIGGVDVYSDYSFSEQAFGIYRFKKGINHLTGKQALAFARERKAFKDGDVQRVKNQQKVFEAIIKKATSSTAIITSFSEILDSVSNNFSTNLDSKSISRLVKMQLSDMASWEIENQNLVGKDSSSINTYTFPGTNLYVMEQDSESVKQVKEKISKYFND